MVALLAYALPRQGGSYTDASGLLGTIFTVVYR